MMLQSHLAATLLLALLLARPARFQPTDWGLALAFGVLIDLDHALKLPRYLASHGAGAFDAETWMAWGAEWQGFMHTAWALVLVVPAVLVFKSAVPVLFWGLHLFLDFFVAREYIVWGSGVEWAVFLALAALLALVWIADPVSRANALDAVRAGASSDLSRGFRGGRASLAAILGRLRP